MEGHEEILCSRCMYFESTPVLIVGSGIWASRYDDDIGRCHRRAPFAEVRKQDGCAEFKRGPNWPNPKIEKEKDNAEEDAKVQESQDG